METVTKTDVIIVGAGPTGLSLAVQLMRYDIDFKIFDQKAGVTDLSKAPIVHARTLEIYDQVDLAQIAIAGGKIAQKVTLMHDGKISAHLDFSDFGGRLSPFPANNTGGSSATYLNTIGKSIPPSGGSANEM